MSAAPAGTGSGQAIGSGAGDGDGNNAEDGGGSAAGGVIVRVHLDDSDDPLPSPEPSIGAAVRLVRHVLVTEGITAAEIDIVFCGDERITRLNREWLGIDAPTDVIAFPLSDPESGKATEGEIYVDLAQAVRQAPEYEATVDEEIRRLVVHGILHLLGYTDTGTPEEADGMRARQEELVAGWNEPLLGGLV